MRYPYENLGPDLFQEFIQSLLLKMNPDVICYPVGQADGGRDAVLAGPDGEGFVVYQVKFSRDPSKVKNPLSWLKEAITSEAEKISDLYSRGALKYYLITNVPGTAKKDSGTMDKVEIIFKELGFRDAQCLWRDDVDRRLDGYPDLRWSYPTLISGMDMLKVLVESGLNENKNRRSLAIKAFLKTEFKKDEKVRFKQVDLQNDLLKLFVDVPITPIEDDSESNTSYKDALLNKVLATTKGQGVVGEEDYEGPMNRFYSRRNVIGTAHFLLNKIVGVREPVIVLEGGPGQGKSTLTQYISQVHRARLLKEMDFLNGVAEDHLNQPVKLPFRIDLRDLSTWLEKRNPFRNKNEDCNIPNWSPSVESFLAAQVTEYSGGTNFSVDDLYAVISISPVLIIFDGLDEVPDIGQRHRVVDSIVESIDRIKETALSLQAIVTTRPAAFSNAPGLPKNQYSTYKLGFVTKRLAKDYARKWSESKNLDVQDSKELYKILDEKLALPHLADLAKNPMQLTILLSLIHSRGVSLPDKRTSLYDRYVDLFFNRESEKSSIIRNHRDLVISLHQYIAWILHSEAEKGSQGRIEYDRIVSVLKHYLEKEGHNPDLVEEIFHGMVERVVFLVSRIEGTFEFEVQPLREYFAGRYLYDTAPYSPAGAELPGTLPDRFDGMCKNFYWLNCIRFFSGCYNKGELHSLIDRLENLLEDDIYKYLSHPRDLAVLLLSDWVFSQYPRSVNRVVNLLFKGGGIRFLGNGIAGRTFLIRDTLKLPESCGRKQLLAFCEKEILNDSATDYSEILTDIIKENSTDIELRYLSDRLLFDDAGKFNPSYVRVVGSVGGFKSYGDEELVAIERKLSDLSNFYEALSKSEQNSFLYEEPDRLEQLMKIHLSGRTIVNPNLSYKSNIDSLFLFLEPAFFNFIMNQAAVFESDPSQPLNSWLENFMGVSFSDLDTDKGCHNENVDFVLKTFRKEFSYPTKTWISDISPYDNVIQAVYDRFGCSPKVIKMACVSAGIKCKELQCKDSPSLFNNRDSLVRRVRYARLRAGSKSWWSNTLEACCDDEQRMLSSIVFLFWSSGRTLSSLIDQLNNVVKQIPSNILSGIILTLIRDRWQEISNSKRVSYDENFSSLAARIETSTLALLSTRLDKRGRQWLVELVVDGYEFSSKEEWRLIMSSIIESLRENCSSDYQIKCLAAVAKCYKECGNELAPLSSYQRFTAYDSILATTKAAKFVMENMTDFPVFLVLHAETFYREKLAKNITPVLDISNSDGWFSSQDN